MQNHWLNHWTFEIIDEKDQKIIPETVIDIDEKPTLKVIESLEEDGVWKPVFIVWEKFEATYKDPNNKNHIRLLEVDGNAKGILRFYELSDHTESWVMHNLKLIDIDIINKTIKANFTFHHAYYVSDDLNNS